MTIDEIRKRFETSDRIISAAHARGEHGPSMDMHAAANIDISALLAAHDLQSARADAAEQAFAALRARVAELDGRVQALGEQGRMWRRRAENAEARAVELEKALILVGDKAVRDWDDETVGLVDAAVPDDRSAPYKEWLRLVRDKLENHGKAEALAAELRRGLEAAEQETLKLRARVAELESHRPGPAPVATEGMIRAAQDHYLEENLYMLKYVDVRDCLNAALRKGRAEGAL